MQKEVAEKKEKNTRVREDGGSYVSQHTPLILVMLIMGIIYVEHNVS